MEQKRSSLNPELIFDKKHWQTTINNIISLSLLLKRRNMLKVDWDRRDFWVFLRVRTCGILSLFHCLVLGFVYCFNDLLFSLFYVIHKFNRFIYTLYL